MTTAELKKTLKVVSSCEGAINKATGEDLQIKDACKILAGHLNAWGMVMNEFNDVISTLSCSEDENDKAYRAAFERALKIVLYANRFKGERINGKRI